MNDIPLIGELTIDISGIPNLCKLNLTTNINSTFQATCGTGTYIKFYFPLYNSFYDLSTNKFKQEFENFSINTNNSKLNIVVNKDILDKFIKKNSKYIKNFTDKEKSEWKDNNKLPIKLDVINNNIFGIIQQLIFNNNKATFIYRKPNESNRLYYIKSKYSNDTSGCNAIYVKNCSFNNRNLSYNIILNIIKQKQIFKIEKEGKTNKESIYDIYKDDKQELEKKIKENIKDTNEQKIQINKIFYNFSKIISNEKYKIKKYTKTTFSDYENEYPIESSEVLNILKQQSNKLQISDKNNIFLYVEKNYINFFQKIFYFFIKERDYLNNSISKDVNVGIILNINDLKQVPRSIIKKYDRKLILNDFKTRTQTKINNYIKDCKVNKGTKYNNIINKCKALCLECKDYNKWCNICRSIINSTYNENIKNSCSKGVGFNLGTLKSDKFKLDPIKRYNHKTYKSKPPNYMFLYGKPRKMTQSAGKKNKRKNKTGKHKTRKYNKYL